MEKRTVVAVVLSFVIIVFYPFFLQKFFPKYAQRQYAHRPVAQETQRPVSNVPAPTVPAIRHDVDAFKGEELVLQNSALRLAVDSEAGAMRSIAFSRFIDSSKGQPIRLFDLKSPAVAPGAFILLNAGHPPVVTRFKQVSSSDESAVFTSSVNGLNVEKTISLSKTGYSGTLTLTFQNTGSSPVDLNYELVVGPDIPARHSIDAQYIEANFYDPSKKEVRHLKESRAGKDVQSVGPVEWVAVKDRHFSVIMKPLGQAVFTAVERGQGDRHFNAGLVSDPVTLPAHGTVKQEFLFYAGPNELEFLEPLGLGTIVNFGKLDGIAKVLVGGLDLLTKIFRNYGTSIIVLTMLINLLLFPLTRASYMSMKRMQLIQPQMSKLREQHKKNPEKLNKEMMELYRKHKVNPFGGCLPMLLQMPVFIALYVAISKSALLINQRFLWIGDLSSPDNVSLPFSLPFLGDRIHILPLIMVGAMVVQQKLTSMSTAGQDPAMAAQQKMMSVTMPILFGFIFYSMPSGLVLYWLTNTVLMSLYQWRLKKVTLS